MKLKPEGVQMSAAVGIPFLLLVLIATACTTASTKPDLERLYRSWASREEGRRPVVVIHGLMGAQLVETATGDVVWGGVGGLLGGSVGSRLALAAAPIPPSVQTTLLGGDCIPTPRALLVEEDQGKPTVRFEISDIRSPLTGGSLEALYFEPGDGTVTKSSLLGAVPAGPAGMATTALPDAHAVFICEEHRALVHNVTFQDNLLHVLLYQPITAAEACGL